MIYMSNCKLFHGKLQRKTVNLNVVSANTSIWGIVINAMIYMIITENCVRCLISHYHPSLSFFQGTYTECVRRIILKVSRRREPPSSRQGNGAIVYTCLHNVYLILTSVNVNFCVHPILSV